MRERERGVVLLVVLFFALLLASSTATFIRRAVIDSMIVRNRDSAAQAEALARGGVQLAIALLLEDHLRDRERDGDAPRDSHLDVWARVAGEAIETDDGGTLRVAIEDAGARLNLNALFGEGPAALEHTEALLEAVFEKVIDEMPIPPGEKVYDARELAQTLIDWVDADDIRLAGGDEDDYYQRQRPPYHASNRPLLSVDELRLLEGFDAALVDALRPYVTVHPFVGGRGVNANTAPPHVLALLYYYDGVTHRLIKEEGIRRILRERAEDRLLCAGQAGPPCTSFREVFGGTTGASSVFPPLTEASEVFRVRVEASVRGIHRTVEAVIDRSDPSAPLLLSWRMG